MRCSSAAAIPLGGTSNHFKRDVLRQVGAWDPYNVTEDADLGIRIPECEILTPTHAIKNFIRTREFFKITSALETGADHGMWTFQRYRNWLDQRKTWHIPGQADDPVPEEPVAEPLTVRITASAVPGVPRPAPAERTKPATGQRIEIEPVEGEFEKILRPRGET